MLENLDQIRQTAAQFQSAVDGQDNLFAEVDKKSTQIKDNFIKLKEYSEPELLSFEKELLGLYLTSHPLADSISLVNKRANMEIAQLSPKHQDQIFLFGGVLSRFKEITTKKGAKMAFATLEDTTGKAELVIFPRIYQKTGQLEQDSVILARAKVQYDGDEVKLLAEKISFPQTDEVEFAAKQHYQEIFVPRKTSKTTLSKLGKLLKSKPGKRGVTIVIPNGARPEKIILPYKVAWTKQLAQEVDELLK